jgi:iron complex outermembrane receptor protein
MGGEFRWNLRQNQASYYQLPYEPLLNDRRASKVAASFVQDEIALNNVLSLNAGLRYDYYSGRGSNVSPRVALVYKRRQNSVFKFIYAQSFRVPNVYEMYYSVPPNLANPWLKPETIRTLEVTWEQGLGKHLWMTLFGFYNGISDLITQESAEGDSMIFRNLHNARSSGIEAEVKARLFHGLEADASYSFQQAKDSGSDTLLNNSPKNLLKFNITQSMLRNRLLASMDAQYTGRMQTITGGSVPSFAVVNLTLLARNLSRGVDLSASIYNLLDKTYYAPPSDAVSLSAIQQDGRSFRVKLTLHFGTR